MSQFVKQMVKCKEPVTEIDIPKYMLGDVFSVLPSDTSNCVTFGANTYSGFSVKDVTYMPSLCHSPPSILKVDGYHIDQTNTFSVMLHKYTYCWGAEMGVNENNVAVGCTKSHVKCPVYSDLSSSCRLTRQDLLRLSLERSNTAAEALFIITSLLEKHGQGTDKLDTCITSSNFLIADPTEVWVLETVDRFWVAENVKCGSRNISTKLSIGKDIDLYHPCIQDIAKKYDLWNPEDGDFNFKEVFEYDNCNDDDIRYESGKYLLKKYSNTGNFTEYDMLKILKDEPSGICNTYSGKLFPISQISILRDPSQGILSSHWFPEISNSENVLPEPFSFKDKIKFPCKLMSSRSNGVCENSKRHRRFEREIQEKKCT